MLRVKSSGTPGTPPPKHQGKLQGKFLGTRLDHSRLEKKVFQMLNL